jgi:adhesin transport system membrane fusion protein
VISADTFKDERTRAEDGNAHYKVRVRVDMGGLTDKQARIEICPGMQAQVELHTGEKTVLQYLLKPLINRVRSSVNLRVTPISVPGVGGRCL